MERIAHFEPVSFNRFSSDFLSCFPDTDPESVSSVYEAIAMPKRATAGSAGYDLYSPIGFTLEPGKTIRIPTGLRVRIQPGWVLAIFPRSGLGFKYRFQLDNSVGIIDSDYYGSDNEGHMFLKMTNDSRNGKTVTIRAGEAVAQGIFLPFGITDDDEASGIRNGGFGSTNRGSATMPRKGE